MSADGLGGEVSNVALSSCQLQLQSGVPASFHVSAVTDFTRDGNRASLIGALPGAGAPRLWRNYIPTSLKVRRRRRRIVKNVVQVFWISAS